MTLNAAQSRIAHTRLIKAPCFESLCDGTRALGKHDGRPLVLGDVDAQRLDALLLKQTGQMRAQATLVHLYQGAPV